VHVGTLQAILDHLPASAFDHVRGDGITRRQVPIIVQMFLVMVKILANLLQLLPVGAVRPMDSAWVMSHGISPPQQSQDQQFHQLHWKASRLGERPASGTHWIFWRAKSTGSSDNWDATL